MKRWLDLNVFLFLAFCTGIIMSISYIGEYTYEAVMGEGESELVFSEGTKVGSVDVSGLDSKAAMMTLLDEVEGWKSNSTIQVVYPNGEITEIVPSVLNFNIKQSVEQAVDKKENPVLFSINSDVFKEQLKVLSEEEKNLLNYNLMQNNLANAVNELQIGEHELQLLSYLPEGVVLKDEVISKSVLTGFNENQWNYLNDYMNKLQPIEIGGDRSFSFLQHVDVVQDHLSEQRLEALNILATSIYEAIVSSNLEITERHISSSLPFYAKLGFEAKVVPGKMDLAFQNNNSNHFTIEIKQSGESLVTVLKGKSLENTYKIKLKGKETLPYRTILQYTVSLSSDSQRLKEAGQVGQIVTVFREEFDNQKKLVEETFISEDYYPPVHKVVEKGIQSVSTPHTGVNNQKQDDSSDQNNDNDSNPETDTNDKEKLQDSEIWGNPNEGQLIK